MDLFAASFSDPTNITNPLFPVNDLESVVLVGSLDGQPWRAENTLLPRTERVEWNGQAIETVRSQFVAYLGGRIFEVAIDRYAQADDGSVWYFGEDAFTYEHGRVADTEGTWLAGVDGPPAMIMPGHPRVGDVYRPENIPGVVFEEVTVEKVGETVAGPTGPIPGAMVGSELHMDESRLEKKTFAPGYGEFFSGGGKTYESTGLVVPADAVAQPVPADLTAISSGAAQMLDATARSDWQAGKIAVTQLETAWQTLRTTSQPPSLSKQMDEALRVLAIAVSSHAPTTSARAIELADVALDIRLRYEPQGRIDLGRFALWTRRLEADGAAGDRGGAAGDVATLQCIRDRIKLDPGDAERLDTQLRLAEAMVESEEFSAAVETARRLRTILAETGAPP